mmetsp:Transcript_108828/g.347386  ORF Transcript_108828/g.347386 Transcript_108828/m.347386 type:complete len:208 (-) Transcript_108828:126-749(-)
MPRQRTPEVSTYRRNLRRSPPPAPFRAPPRGQPSARAAAPAAPAASDPSEAAGTAAQLSVAAVQMRFRGLPLPCLVASSVQGLQQCWVWRQAQPAQRPPPRPPTSPRAAGRRPPPWPPRLAPPWGRPPAEANLLGPLRTSAPCQARVCGSGAARERTGPHPAVPSGSPLVPNIELRRLGLCPSLRSLLRERGCHHPPQRASRRRAEG